MTRATLAGALTMISRPSLVHLSFLVFTAAGCAEYADHARSRRSNVAGDNEENVATSNDVPRASVGDSTRGQAIPSKACKGSEAKAALAGGISIDSTMAVWGNERTYDLAVPATYNPSRAYPVVFVFHGSGGTAGDIRSTFRFEELAGEEAVFVYPNARDHHWNLDGGVDDNEDIAFFEQLLTTLETSLCIDSSRVFATGYSNGGYFANQLACRRGDLLRAIASHGGGGPYGGDDAYDEEGNLKCAAPPPAVMLVHGEADNVVELWKAESSLSHWARANGCDASFRPNASGPCVSFAGCKNPVVWCQLPEHGHWVWSEGANATWEFFSGF